MSRFLTTNRNIELLEPYEGKPSRTVLRGEGGSNALDLPDVQKQGDFFVESPIILFASIIWYLKIYQGGIYCTFPHAIEFLNRRYEDIFPILTSYPELENYLSPFMDAWLGGAAEQLMGQIASAKIPLSRMISPQLYWVMSDSEFTLDINNPEEPKILCVGNNPDRQNIYGAALGLYNSRIVKLINKKGMLKSSVIIDELPTIYFKGLDNLIATARSNKVAVCLGFQDFSQLVRDYGDKEAKVVMNTVGNIFSGQVVGETAKTLSERFGKVLQKRQSIPSFWLKCILSKNSEQPLESSLSSDDVLFVSESKIIQELAAKESCIIVGRCADFVLKDYPKVLKLFCYSDLSHSVTRCVSEYGIAKESAETEIKRVNRNRIHHYEYYTGEKWGEPHRYDLMLNTGALDLKTACQLVRGVYQGLEKA